MNLTVGTELTLDMYEALQIVEDLGEQVRLQNLRNNQTKVVYKSLIRDFGDIHNQEGLSRGCMERKIRHLKVPERNLLYVLRYDGYKICTQQGDCCLVDNRGRELQKVKKRTVLFLESKGMLRTRKNGDYVLNSNYFL